MFPVRRPQWRILRGLSVGIKDLKPDQISDLGAKIDFEVAQVVEDGNAYLVVRIRGVDDVPEGLLASHVDEINYEVMPVEYYEGSCKASVPNLVKDAVESKTRWDKNPENPKNIKKKLLGVLTPKDAK
jgi:hypothetical protein